MFKAAALIATLLLAISVSANPVVTEPKVSLPFTLKLNTNGSTLPDIDRSRAAHLIARAKLGKRASSFPVTNTAVTYTAEVGVGSPATTYTLLIDTGSSNTWVGANKPYKQTSTSQDTGLTVSVTYGSGSFSGKEFIDKVTLSSGLVINNQSIGVATSSSEFRGIDGILGIGPVDLTQGTLSSKSQTIPTVTDNLFNQGTISSNSIGISYNPITTSPTTNGELTFGGTDSTRFTGSINFVPITSTSPANEYWGVNQNIKYGSSTGTSILSSTAGIVDTGTTLVLIATDAFDAYTKAVGATMDQATGLLKISSANFSKLKSLFFNIGGESYELTANAQIWPRSLNADIGGTAGSIYLIIADLGSVSGEGLDFINGYTFLERYYTVYDTGNKRVGFATTHNTFATSN